MKPKLKTGYKCPHCHALGFIQKAITGTKWVKLSCGHLAKKEELVKTKGKE